MTYYPRLLIVDGSHMLARAAFVNPNPPLSELPERIRGMLWNMLERHRPDYLMVALDCTEEKNFRHDLIPGYKDGREGKAPYPIRDLVRAVREHLDAWNVAIREHPGMEADDVIAALTRLSRGVCRVSVWSRDTDMLQLVNDSAQVNVIWPDGGGQELFMDEETVKTRIGVRPDQLLDFRVMVGKKDNLPRIGIEREGKKPWGFTPKRAVQLLSEVDRLDDLFGKERERLTDREQKWMDCCAEDAKKRREALRLRNEIIPDRSKGRTDVGRLRL